MKKGFTLAEVLVTLTIVGVIAAITLPTFTASTTNAQIGPKLAKSVSMLEQANMALLSKHNVDSLTDSGFITLNGTVAAVKAGTSTEDGYMEELMRHLKISKDSATEGLSKDGVSYTFASTDSNVVAGEPPHKQRIGLVTIDINGNGNRPNLQATDKFNFSWWNDGTLRPQGAVNWDGDSTPAGSANHWANSSRCPLNSVPTDPAYCTGHIFENNMKVLYR